MAAEMRAARRVMRETETETESAEAEQREAGAVPSRQPNFTSLHFTSLHFAVDVHDALCNGERAPSGSACARTD